MNPKPVKQDLLDQALSQLAEERSSQRPSTHVESSLLAEFRQQAGRRRQRRVWIGLAAAAAVAIAVWAGLRPDAGRPIRQAVTEPARPPVVTEFVSLDYGLTDPGFVSAGRLARVTLPPTAPRELGFPIPPATLPNGVQADLLLSEDGTPQAVRFILPYRQ